jgi:hypothetical protein
MDPLSVTASIIAVVTVTGKFAQYLRDVQDGPEERVNCATEASNLYRLFIKLSFHLEGQNVDAPWFKAVRDLAFKDGPLDQLKKALETLLAKVEVASESRKVVQALKWKFDEEEVKSILDRMERLKVLVVIALGMDHLWAFLSSIPGKYTHLYQQALPSDQRWNRRSSDTSSRHTVWSG